MAWRRVIRRFLAVVVGAGVVGLVGSAASAPTAGASCSGSPGGIQETIDYVVQDGGTAFVGTVVSTTNDSTWATFAVEEVWAGDVADEVVVRSDGEHRDGGFQMVGETPFDFEAGERYLVLPTQVRPPFDSYFGTDEGGYEISPCGPWPETYPVGTTAFRPASARIIERDQPIEIIGAVPLSSEEETRPWLVIGGAAVVFVVISGALVLRWRRAHVPVDVDVDGTYL